MKRWLSILLAAAMLLGLLAACGTTETSAPAETSAVAESAETAEAPAEEVAENAPAEEPEVGSAEEEAAPEEVALPFEGATGLPPVDLPLVEEPETLTMFVNWFPVDESLLNSMEDYLVVTTAEELTGVHIDYSMTSAANYAELLNITLAAGDYRDIIAGMNYAYTSGISGALNDEIIINLHDYLEECAPHYSAQVETIDYGWAQVSVDDSTVGAFYTLMQESDKKGLLIRADWLEELGLEAPETYDEYHDVLTAMKNEYDCYGFCLSESCLENYTFASGFGTPGYTMSFFGSGSYWYQVDGQVKNALIEDGYRQYLELMHQYYEEGLLNPDFISVSEMGNDQGKVSDQANGVYALFSCNGRSVDTYMDATTDPNFKLVATKHPVQNKGDVVHINGFEPVNNNGMSASVSTACENPELAIRWLDFWYSDEGILMGNVGVEGETFEIRDGEIYYTDLILKSEYTLETASQLYVPVGMVATKRIVVKSVYSDLRREAEATWDSNSDNAYVLPMITLTTDESEAYKNGLGDMETFAQECIPAFINGSKPLSEWDSYVESLKSFGIEEKIEIYQAALDRMQ